jgi:hypothetical protein
MSLFRFKNGYWDKTAPILAFGEKGSPTPRGLPKRAGGQKYGSGKPLAGQGSWSPKEDSKTKLHPDGKPSPSNCFGLSLGSVLLLNSYFAAGAEDPWAVV